MTPEEELQALKARELELQQYIEDKKKKELETIPSIPMTQLWYSPYKEGHLFYDEESAKKYIMLSGGTLAPISLYIHISHLISAADVPCSYCMSR